MAYRYLPKWYIRSDTLHEEEIEAMIIEAKKEYEQKDRKKKVKWFKWNQYCILLRALIAIGCIIRGMWLRLKITCIIIMSYMQIAYLLHNISFLYCYEDSQGWLYNDDKIFLDTKV